MSLRMNTEEGDRKHAENVCISTQRRTRKKVHPGNSDTNTDGENKDNFSRFSSFNLFHEQSIYRDVNLRCGLARTRSARCTQRSVNAVTSALFPTLRLKSIEWAYCCVFTFQLPNIKSGQVNLIRNRQLPIVKKNIIEKN